MLNYPNNKIYPTPMGKPGDERFIFPFLLGGLAGGAAVGLTRPRPIYNVAPQPYPPYPPYQPYPPFRPYGGYSYTYASSGYNNYPY